MLTLTTGSSHIHDASLVPCQGMLLHLHAQDGLQSRVYLTRDTLAGPSIDQNATPCKVRVTAQIICPQTLRCVDNTHHMATLSPCVTDGSEMTVNTLVPLLMLQEPKHTLQRFVGPARLHSWRTGFWSGNSYKLVEQHASAGKPFAMSEGVRQGCAAADYFMSHRGKVMLNALQFVRHLKADTHS